MPQYIKETLLQGEELSEVAENSVTSVHLQVFNI